MDETQRFFIGLLNGFAVVMVMLTMLLLCSYIVLADDYSDMNDNIGEIYAMEDASNPLTDGASSYGDLDFSPLTPTFQQTGKVNYGTYWDGTDFGDTGRNAVTSATSFSFGCWVNPDSTDSDTFYGATGNELALAIGAPKCTTARACFLIYDGSDKIAEATTVISTSTWYLIVGTYNGATDEMLIYVNDGASEDSATATHIEAAVDINMGGTNNADYSGYLDECFYYPNYVLSQSQIEALYNDGDGLEYPYSAPAASGIYNVTIIEPVNSTLYSEKQKFYIKANYSIDGDTITSSTLCNFTTQGISAVFGFDEGNVSLESGQEDHDFNTTESFSSQPIYDEFRFRVCESSVLGSDLHMYVNGNIYLIVNSTVIPSCDTGFHEEINISENFVTQNDINITLSCPTCTDAAHSLRIVSDGIETLSLTRHFNVHHDDIKYNSTSGLYEYTNHPYAFTNASAEPYNITVNCNGTLESTILSILDVNLTINIQEINGLSFYEGINVPSTDTTNISVDIYGDNVVFSELNVSYDNGTTISSVNDEFITLTDEQLNVDGLYRINVLAIDDELNTFEATGTFILNDTEKPFITSIFPASDNSSTLSLNDTQALDITVSDLNLFAYEVLVYNPSTDIYYNFTDIGLTTESEHITDSITVNETGTWIVHVEATDSHTRNKIENYSNMKSVKNKELKFLFNKIDDEYYLDQKNVSIYDLSTYTLNSISTEKHDDKYSFMFGYDMEGSLGFWSVVHRYRVECEDITFIEHSGYTAHFVCPASENWIDFENPDVLNWNVVRQDDNSFDVILTMIPKEKVVFSSIGGLNKEAKDYSFNVTSVTVSADQTSANEFKVGQQCRINTLQETLFFMFLGILVVGFYIVCKSIIRMPIVTIISVIGLLYYGMLLYTCQSLLSVLIIALSIIFGWYEWETSASN